MCTLLHDIITIPYIHITIIKTNKTVVKNIINLSKKVLAICKTSQYFRNYSIFMQMKIHKEEPTPSCRTYFDTKFLGT